jgi:DeoR/GlpR family transcriptional regulator of sugar metabolism
VTHYGSGALRNWYEIAQRQPEPNTVWRTSQWGRMTQPGPISVGPEPIPATEGGNQMLARHRQSLILQAVRSDGSARVSELTQQLGVSDMTIRRDLEVLAREGLIEKVHGGAVLPGSPASHDPGFEAKLVLERPEKTAIARAAASLVRPGTAIALAGGTTTFALAQCLLDVPGLTIVTNSLRVTNLFSGIRGLDGPADSVVITGGVRTPSDSLVGPVADLTIRSLHFDVLFLGCSGIDAEAGLSTPNLAEAETNRSFIRVARRVVVLADHTKWGLVSLASFAGLAEVDTLITDDGLPETARPQAAGVGDLIIAEPLATLHPLPLHAQYA